MSDSKNLVAVLLCTHNGARFLHEQLESFTKQTHTNWHLYVYDDGSSDNTRGIIEEYKKSVNNRVVFIPTQHKNFAKNFLSAVCSTDGDYDFWAFSDQDDIWEPFKLERAVTNLNQSNTGANLYCTRTGLIDNGGKFIGLSTLFIKIPSFKNAIVQSIAGGNTMVFNKAARDLIVTAGSEIDIVSHDWWIYQLISGSGGNVFYDPVPSLLYRQHEGNLMGSNNGIYAKISRLIMLLNGQFKDWNDRNISALTNVRFILSTESQHILDEFVALRKMGMIKRMVTFYRSGIYRQTFLGNVGLLAGILLDRV